MTYSMILDMENYMEGEMQDGMEYSRLAEIAPNKRARRLLEEMSEDEIGRLLCSDKTGVYPRIHPFC